MKGMTLRAMTQAVNGIYHGNGEDYDKEITAITIDSRKVAEGGLFIAIKGERSDGHDFIGQCFEKGAACVISEKELPDEERSYIQVESSLQALKDLAAGATAQIESMPGQSMKMAMAVIVTGPVLLFYPFVQRYFVSGITVGAVKG